MILAVTLASAGSLAVFGAGSGTGYVLRGYLDEGKCACGHAWSCVDRFSGHCTETRVQREFAGGFRKGRKRVGCACREHRPRAEMREVSYADVLKAVRPS